MKNPRANKNTRGQLGAGVGLFSLLAAAFAGGPADKAFANTSWVGPADVSVDDGWDADDPQIAVSDDGTFVAVWSQDIDSGDPVIKASRSTNGIDWSTPVLISDNTENAGIDDNDSANPQIAVSDDGRFVIVWTYDDDLVQASTSTDGLSWSVPAVVSDVSDESVRNPQITVNPDGRFVAVWSWDEDNAGAHDDPIVLSAYSDNGSTWTDPTVVSKNDSGNQDNDAANPQITVSDNGRFVTVWTYDDEVIKASTSTDGATWSNATTISPDDSSDYVAGPQVTVDADGTFVAVWSWDDEDAGDPIIQASTSSNGSAWSSPSVVSKGDDGNADNDATEPQIAVSRSGQFVAIWTYDDDLIKTATSPDGENWANAVTLLTADATEPPQIIVSADGRFMAVWGKNTVGDDDVIQAAWSTNGTTWSTPATLSNDNGYDADNPQIAVSSGGRFVVVWAEDSAGEDDMIQASTILWPSETKPRADEPGPPGIFLSLQSRVGDSVVGTPVVFGAFSAGNASPMVLTLTRESPNGPSTQVMRSSRLTTAGHLEQRLFLSALSPGTYLLVANSESSFGSHLYLANRFIVSSDGSFAKITPEQLQPVTR